MVKLVKFMFLIFTIVSIHNASHASDRSIILVKSSYDGESIKNRYLKGVNRALIIGINEYKYQEDLTTAVRDAEEVKNLLQERYYFSPENIIFLTNGQATKANIVDKFKELYHVSGKGDNVFIYYAGHGWKDPIFNQGYWITTEATTKEITYLENSYIFNTIAALDKKGVQHILLVSDSCFAGSFVKPHRSPMTEIDDRFFREYYRNKSRIVLTSGGHEKVSDKGRDGHSIFAYYFLKILRENEFPYLSSEQVALKVKELVTRNSSQHPLCQFIQGVGDEGGTFFFINKQAYTKPEEFGEISQKEYKLPGESSVSFDDLDQRMKQRQEAKKREKEAKDKWSSWLKDRQSDYEKTKGYDSNKYLTKKEKISAWQRFLNSCSDDDPYSSKDDDMRTYARKRLDYWQNWQPTATPKPKRKPKESYVKPSTYGKKTSSDGRFIDNGDGTVTDTKTGLMWTQKDSYADLGDCLNWNDSKEYVRNLTTGGYSDWRMPTVDELKGIYESSKGHVMAKGRVKAESYRRREPVYLDSIFADGGAYWYWSSEEAGSCCARRVNFSDGAVSDLDRYYCFFGGVRAVRSGQSVGGTSQSQLNRDKDVSPTKKKSSDGRFIDNGDGTVTDTKTGLMWASRDNVKDVNWQGAKEYCESYSVGGYHDWRMPTQNELAGLYEPSKNFKPADDWRDLTYHIDSMIHITEGWQWASETRGSSAAVFLFGSGYRVWQPQDVSVLGALPVRGGK